MSTTACSAPPLLTASLRVNPSQRSVMLSAWPGMAAAANIVTIRPARPNFLLVPSHTDMSPPVRGHGRTDSFHLGLSSAAELRAGGGCQSAVVYETTRRNSAARG